MGFYRLTWVWLFFTVAWPAGRASEPAPPGNTNALILAEVVDQVLINNAGLKKARAEWEAMRHRIPQARAWEDLQAGVDVERMDTTKLFTSSVAEWMVGQEIPISGKNRLRGRAALAEAAAAFNEVRRQEIALSVRAAVAYFQLANAIKQLELNEKNARLWKQFSEVTRTKYELGARPQADVLMAETEVAKIGETLVDNGRAISEAHTALNVLMQRAPTEPLGNPVFWVPQVPAMELGHLQELALKNRPELHVAMERIRAAEARVDLARREWIPDPELRLEARQFNGRGGGFQEYDTGIFFKLPWLNHSKYSAAIKEARKMHESAQHEIEQLKTETLGAVRDQLTKITTAHHHVELFRTRLLPLAEQTVASKRIGYEAEHSSFLELLTAQQTAQEIESMYWHHLTDLHVALAELKALIGMEPERASAQDRRRRYGS